MTSRRVIASLVVALLPACSLGDSDDKKERTRVEFCADWASAACSDEVLDVCNSDTAEACQESQAEYCLTLVPEDFSDREGDACISAVKAAYADGQLCDEELGTVLRLATPCDRLIVGPNEEGEACTQSSDCDRSAGLDCVRKADADEGSCEVPEVTGAGRACDEAQQTCEAGFFCDGSNCIEAKGVGAQCTIPEQCEAGTQCIQGECTELLVDGEPCEQDDECAAGICYEYDGETTCTDRIVISRAEPICELLK